MREPATVHKMIMKAYCRAFGQAYYISISQHHGEGLACGGALRDWWEHAEDCVGGLAPWSLNTALRELPHQAFDYVWLIDPPAYDPRLIAGLEPVWRGAGTTLFRIRH